VTTERRRFLVTASGTLAAMTAAAVVDAPNVIAQPKVQWRMSTTWPTSLDVMQGSAQRLAKLVEEATGGRFKIETFGDGQIMPAFDCFPAASQGTIESFMAAPSYWASKEPAIEWFQTVPFGMNPEGMMAWYYEGDGLTSSSGKRPMRRSISCRARAQPSHPRWPVGSGRRSTPLVTSRASRCGLARASATR
jgi:TRAP-type mannitol/chloroaromatic compound transport system substrate-binding protein